MLISLFTVRDLMFYRDIKMSLIQELQPDLRHQRGDLDPQIQVTLPL